MKKIFVIVLLLNIEMLFAENICVNIPPAKWKSIKVDDIQVRFISQNYQKSNQLRYAIYDEEDNVIVVGSLSGNDSNNYDVSPQYKDKKNPEILFIEFLDAGITKETCKASAYWDDNDIVINVVDRRF